MLFDQFQFTIASSSFLATRCSFSPTEYHALFDLYNSTNGVDWVWRSNAGTMWNFTSYPNIINNPCLDDWAYLRCTLNKCNILAIQLSGVNLYGTLPESIGDFSLLQNLEIVYNFLSMSSIPLSIGNLQNLELLLLNENDLIGSIPDTLFQLSNINTILLGSNRLHGSISPMFQQLTTLKQLGLSDNDFTGTIPPEITTLTNLTLFEISSQTLVGSIPSSIGQLINLRVLHLERSPLTSTIPASIGNCINLNYLYILGTYITGTIPESIGNLTNLVSLHIYSNYITGSFPKSFGKLVNLNQFLLTNNDLTGTIPDSFENLQNLLQFDIYGNFLTGTFPSFFGQMSRMVYLNINYNMFTGTIPKQLFSSNKLLAFGAMYNMFTGTLPTETCSNNRLTYLILSNNYLSGTIPRSIQGCNETLQYINVANNSFDGTINNIFDVLPKLSDLILAYNDFYGSIDNVFNHTLQDSLRSIDFSHNSFTGTIPDDIFLLPSITVFAAVTNCFHGSIPSTICLANQSLQVLALDGLYTSKTCRHRIFSLPNIKTYPLLNPLLSTIPTCLFTDFYQLSTLHLSGNGLKGSLSNAITHISPNLSDLSLSHNLLTGTIPKCIQDHAWGTIDLSFNKFHGSVDLTTSTSSSSSSLNWKTANVTLNVNRFSGNIPSSLLNFTHINILNGNMFSCPLNSMKDRSQHLPINDPDYSSYECGSNSMDLTVITWFSLIGFIVVLVLILYKSRFSAWIMDCYHILSRYFNIFSQYKDSIGKIGNIFHLIRHWCLTITCLIVLIFCPLYASLSIFFRTYSHVYIWIVSAGFLSGWLPAFFCLLFMSSWLMLLFVVKDDWNIFHVNRVLVISTSSSEDELKKMPSELLGRESSSSRNNSMALRSISTISTINMYLYSLASKSLEILQHHNSRWYGQVCLFILCNMGIVLTVNMAYVYLESNANEHNSSLTLYLPVFMSIYKLGWNHLIIQCLNWLGLFKTNASAINDNKNSHDKNTSDECQVTEKQKNKDEIQPQINSESEIIRSESLEEGSVTSFKSNRSNISNEQYNYGLIFTLTWISLFNHIIAPCIAIAFINSNCFYYAIVPATNISTSYIINECYQFRITESDVVYCNENTDYRQLSFTPSYTYSFQCSSSLLSNFAQVFIYRFMISSFVLPLFHVFVKQAQIFVYYHPQWKKYSFSFINSILPLVLLPSLGFDFELPSNKFLPTETIIIVFITDISIVIIFGTLFPPIALIGCISIVITSIYHQILYGRLICLASSPTSSSSLPSSTLAVSSIRMSKRILSHILIHLQHLDVFLAETLRKLSGIIAIIWAWFVWDIMGDQLGLKKSIWILVVMPFLPMILTRIHRVIEWKYSFSYRNTNQPTEDENKQSIELRASVFSDNNSHKNDNKFSANLQEKELDDFVIQNPILS